MRKGFWLIVILFSLMLMFSACSGTEHQLLTENSSPSRDNAIIVMGIKWVEDYNDTETKENKTQISYDLPKNEEELNKVLVEAGKPELHRALYYLNKFVFHWSDDKGKEHSFTRFDKDLRQYQNIAMYELPPGQYSLNEVEMRQFRFEDVVPQKGPERWKRYLEKIDEKLGTWDLPAGKILYLGDLTFHFKTRRFVFGLISQEELIQSIKLVDIKIENKFEEMKAAIKEQKPWFPVDQIDNIAVENQWTYVKTEEEKSPETPQDKKDTEKKNTFY